jgi:hypothetical protein
MSERGGRKTPHGGGNQVDGGKTGETSPPWDEKLMWKGTGRVAGNERMAGRKESHAG